MLDRMSKKMKVDSTTPYRVGAYEDDRPRLKYQTLMQDYHELQKVLSLFSCVFCFDFGRSEVSFVNFFFFCSMNKLVDDCCWSSWKGNCWCFPNPYLANFCSFSPNF